MNDTLQNDAADPGIAPDVAPQVSSTVADSRGWAAGAAFVVWLLVRDRSAFAAAHAKEALNFNFSMFLYAVASILLVVFTLGLGLLVAVPLWIALAIAWLVFTIIAAVKAYDGETYRYPLTIRLF